MKSLDRLLNEIAKEPFYKDIQYSKKEIEFLRELAKLRQKDYGEFARYLHAYNEIKNSKLITDE